MRFGDFDILINKGFLDLIQEEFDQYIAYSAIRGNMQQFTSEEEDRTKTEKIF